MFITKVDFAVVKHLFPALGTPRGPSLGGPGPPWRPKSPRSPSGRPLVAKKGVQGTQKIAFLRLKIESKIVLISGAETVVAIEAQRLAKRSLASQKTKGIL